MAFTLIREERITHTGNGLQLDDDLYIKLDAAFDELVAELGRGGQLPALIHIQLREAFASSGRGDPATLKTIANAASCGERQAQRIVKSLLAKTLITEAGMSPRTGEKFYRPIGYAWFGNRRPTDRVTSMTPPHSDNEKRAQMSPQMTPNVTPDAKCHPPDTVVVDVEQTKKQNSEQTTTQTRRILRACGIFGKPLDRLAESVAPETAQAWLDWLENPPKNLRNPIGVVINALLADHDARPVVREKQDAPRVRRPTITGKLAELSHTEGGDA